MKSELNFKDKNIWIAGGGKSGLAAAKLLKSAGAEVFLSDMGPLNNETKVELQKIGIEFEENGHNTQAFLAKAELLVVSPAIPRDKGLFQLALAHGMAVVSEIEVAQWFRPAHQKWIGVTGTNGKSTTTHFLAQLIKQSVPKTVACGNIGLPVCEVVSSADVLVIELSSYQLETTFTAIFDASIFLNLQEDHLLRYKSLDQYFRAKWRLIGMTKAKSPVVMPISIAMRAMKCGQVFPNVSLKFLDLESDFPAFPDDQLNSEQELTTARMKIKVALENPSLAFSLYGDFEKTLHQMLPSHHKYCVSHSLNSGVQLKKSSDAFECISNSHLKDLTIQIPNPVLPGQHNATNLAASALIAYNLELCTPVQITDQWTKETSSYSHLPHRLEFCGESNQGVRFFNDSKATNLESLQVALKSFSQNVLLLLGGEPKGENFASLMGYLNSPVKKFYTFGRAASQVQSDLKLLADPAKLLKSLSMLDAAEMAFTDAEPGDIILLSPGCASFDEFKNFEHRGDTFREWTSKLVT
jgi:UDP-N-acetylmuramoylalanine--D-glutamate ligase